MSFERLKLRIPADRHCCHYVKAHVLVLRRCDGTVALMHGPRKLAEYDAAAQLLPANHRVAA